MPYPPEHKQETRARIVACARALFNRRGFTEVSIDEIMAAAGLTRGGFYHHFKTKEALYAEALDAYSAERMADMPKDRAQLGLEFAQAFLSAYVSREHLDDVNGHCPLMALPSDVARAGPGVRAAYQRVLEAMAGLFEASLAARPGLTARQQGLALTAACVGAMVLARTIEDAALADDICEATRALAYDAMAPATEDGPPGKRTGAGLSA